MIRFIKVTLHTFGSNEIIKPITRHVYWTEVVQAPARVLAGSRIIGTTLLKQSLQQQALTGNGAACKANAGALFDAIKQFSTPGRQPPPLQANKRFPITSTDSCCCCKSQA
jgi:hypothetical protein